MTFVVHVRIHRPRSFDLNGCLRNSGIGRWIGRYCGARRNIRTRLIVWSGGKNRRDPFCDDLLLFMLRHTNGIDDVRRGRKKIVLNTWICSLTLSLRMVLRIRRRPTHSRNVQRRLLLRLLLLLLIVGGPIGWLLNVRRMCDEMLSRYFRLRKWNNLHGNRRRMRGGCILWNHTCTRNNIVDDFIDLFENMWRNS